MKTFLLLNSFYFLALSAFAQNTAQLPIDELVREGLAHNPEVRFYELEIDAARAAGRTAGRLPPPELDGSAGHKETREPGGRLAGEGLSWSVGVSQNFEWPGRLGLRKAIAGRDVTLAELGLARFRNALAARIRGEAYALFADQEKARVARDVATRYRNLREVLVQRDPAGIAPQLEIRVLEATELNIRRKAMAAETAANDARLRLNQLLGRPVDAALAVLPGEPALKDPPAFEECVHAARTNNFELRLKVVELEQQGFRVELAKNERWPSITAGPRFSEEKSDVRDRVIAAGVSIPIPLWKNNSGKIEAAKAREEQARTLLEVTERDLLRRISSALRTCEVKREEMSNWRADSVKQFAEAAAQADRHYRLGAVPATIYVELQKQYLDAVETLLDTRREAIAAAAELEELTGLQLILEP